MFDWLAGLADHIGLTLTGVIWTATLGLLLFVGSILMVTILVVYIPTTYFLERDHRRLWIDRRPLLRLGFLVVKNFVGLVLVAAGIVMLFGPGQGVLTILIGVMLLNFPGKRRLERWLVS